MRKAFFALVLMSSLLNHLASAQNIYLDPTFATRGISRINVPGADAVSIKGGNIVELADGKIILSGYAEIPVFGQAGRQNLVVARLLSNGKLDSSFATNGLFFLESRGAYRVVSSSEDKSLAVQGDGKIVAVTNMYNSSTFRIEMAVIRLLPNGMLDNTFGNQGLVFVDIGTGNDLAKCVLIQPDQKILVGGSAENNGVNSATFAFARLLPNGSFDEGFNQTGKRTYTIGGMSEIVRSMKLQSDRKILFCGAAQLGVSTTPRMAVARLNGDGSVDYSFNAGTSFTIVPSQYSSVANDLAIDDNGRIVLVGFAFTPSVSDVFVARILPNGAMDATFGFSGYASFPLGNQGNSGQSVKLKNGKILIAAYAKFLAIENEFALIRLNANGTLDQSFDMGGYKLFNLTNASDIPAELIIREDERILTGGVSGGALAVIRTTASSPNCNTIKIEGGINKIKIDGDFSARSVVWIYKEPSGAEYSVENLINRTDSVVYSNLLAGTYRIKIQKFDINEQLFCEVTKLVTVTDDPSPFYLSVQDVTVNESRGSVHLVICGSRPTSTPVSVVVTTRDSSAKAGSDYQFTRDTVYIPGLAPCWSLDFPLINDSLHEDDEYLLIQLSDAVGGLIQDSISYVKITDDDPPAVSCNSIQVLPQQSSIQVKGLVAPRINVQVSNSAWASVFNQQYTNSPGNITIPNLQAGKYYVSVIFMKSDWTGICTREFYDVEVGSAAVRPTITLNNVTVNESVGLAYVDICLKNAGQEFVSVGVRTVNGTAIAEQDFVSLVGAITLNKDDSCRTVQIRITDDGLTEPTENFQLAISLNSGVAEIINPSATITIEDNDQNGSPCADMVVEAAPGSIAINNLVAPIALVQVSTSTWSVLYNEIHRNFNGNLTIPSLGVGTYYVRINLFDANWNPICEKEAYITVSSGNNVPNLVVNDITVNENTGLATLQICLSQATNLPVTVNFETATIAGSAVSPGDFTAKSGQLTFAPGQTCTSLVVNITNDFVQEPTEQFSIRLSNPVNALLPDNLANITILDDDTCASGVICVRNVCPSPTVDLRTAYNLPLAPPGVSVTWHRDPVASTANMLSVAEISNIAQSGTFYASIQINNNGSVCYSSTIRVNVIISACNIAGFLTETGTQKSPLVDLESNNLVNVVPNPFRDGIVVTINAQKEEKAIISITDLTGRVIIRRNATLAKGKNNITFDGLAPLSAGTYFVQILSNSIQNTVRMIKQ